MHSHAEKITKVIIDSEDTSKEILEYPDDVQFGKASPGKIGMWIFLGTDVCLNYKHILHVYFQLDTPKKIRQTAQTLHDNLGHL